MVGKAERRQGCLHCPQGSYLGGRIGPDQSRDQGEMGKMKAAEKIRVTACHRFVEKTSTGMKKGRLALPERPFVSFWHSQRPLQTKHRSDL
jgi:hypothetical protein